MFKIWATIVKDVKILLRDKVGILLIFIMPVILVFVITSIQSSTFQLADKDKLPILVSNADTGQISRQFISSIDKVGLFKVEEQPGIISQKAMTNAMHKKDAMLGIIIPPDFSAKVEAKAKNLSGKALNSFGLQGDTTKKADPGPLTVYYNPVLQGSIKLSVQGGIGSALQLVESRETLRKLYFSINEKPLPAALENQMLNNNTPINEVPVSRSGAIVTPNATQHNVPAWTIFAMFFIVMSLGGTIVREKNSGSFLRLKTLPTSYLVNILSKQLTYLGVTILQAAVIFLIGIWLFPYVGLPALNLPSDVLALIVVTIICGWCAVSYAICVGVFAETPEQANGFGAVSVVILAAIGGLMVPSFAMQGFFKTISVVSPMHWCLQAYYTLFLEGGKLTDVLNNIVSLLIIAIVLQLVTYWQLKRKNLI